MNKGNLIDRVVQATGMRKKDVDEVVNSVFDTVLTALAESGEVKISGFGTFFVHERGARMARNPRTGAAVPVPAKKVPKFKAARAMKEML